MPPGIRRLAAALMLLLPPADRARAAEYLVVERPDRLGVLNRYEQEASAGDRAVLTPFVPLRILRISTTLSDGFTRATQVEAGGATFFLLRDDRGLIAQGGDPGLTKTYSGAEPLNDTVVVGNGSLLFSPILARRHALSGGARLIRFFRHEGRIYCGVAGTGEYGWVDAAAGNRTWKTLVREGGPALTLNETLRKQISAEIAGVNRALASLYAHFNRETGRQERPPLWNVEGSGAGLICRLTGPREAGHFRASTETLAREIENILLGTPMRVVQGPGTIEVRAE